MARRLQVGGPRNAAGHVVKDGEGTPTVLALSNDSLSNDSLSNDSLSNDSSTDAKPIGAPKHGPGPATIWRQRGVR